jgi:hypothetical protein
MFQLRKEKHYVEHDADTGGWIEQDVLAREDGVSLRLIGILSERQVEFVYTDKDIAFEVTATRFDESGRIVGDTWEVLLGLALKYAPKEVSVEKSREIARNLDAALRAWPPFPDEGHVPIRNVLFKRQFWRD